MRSAPTSPATSAGARAMSRSSRPACRSTRRKYGDCRAFIPRERWSTNWPRAAEVAILIETGRGFSSARLGWRRPSHFARAIPARSSPPAPPSWASQRNKQGFEPPALLSLAGISELAKITRDDGVLSVGANVTWARLEAFAQDTLPEIHALTQRFGSPQIRNVATLVGNIAHGSPVADSLCFLMIVEAELELISMRGTRRVAIKDFHTGPKQTVVAPDEIITRVLIPLTAPDEIVKLYKISKRKEMDVSTFRAGIRISRRGERIESAAIAYCGVGPTVLRLPATEAFLAGRPFSEATFREAGAVARAEVEPITDVRGSRAFRLQLAENILRQVLSRNGRSGALGRMARRGRSPACPVFD